LISSGTVPTYVWKYATQLVGIYLKSIARQPTLQHSLPQKMPQIILPKSTGEYINMKLS